MKDEVYEYEEGYWSVVNKLELMFKEYQKAHKSNMRKLMCDVNGSSSYDSLFKKVTEETEHLLLMSRMIRIVGLMEIWSIQEYEDDLFNRGKQKALEKISVLIHSFEEYAVSEEKHSVVFLHEMYKRLCGALDI